MNTAELLTIRRLIKQTTSSDRRDLLMYVLTDSNLSVNEACLLMMDVAVTTGDQRFIFDFLNFEEGHIERH